ncbi:MAG: tetratricopeptide repeat protein [Fimbriimonadaceae bacterium]
MKIARTVIAAGLLVAAGSASAQFVWPKPEYNRPVPGTYVEDPFIVKYRADFFRVFRGDVETFQRAFAEIETMVRRNPDDPRARVWLGNGQTVKAVLAVIRDRDRERARSLLELSWANMDRAVARSPRDPNIRMMRAATLYVQGQYLPEDMVPGRVWEQLRDDCLWFIGYIGPERMRKVSIHVRGETFGELGIAYLRLGQPLLARGAFQRVIELNPGTAYEERARREIARLDAARDGGR